MTKKPRITSLLILGLAGLFPLMGACGVKQFNAHNYMRPSSSGVAAWFNFPQSGQQGGDLQPGAGPCGGSGSRPCIRARATIGVPFHYDMNSNDSQGRIATGVNYPAPGSYTTLAGAGAVGDNIGVGEHYFRNRDIEIMRRAAASTDHVFP